MNLHCEHKVIQVSSNEIVLAAYNEGSEQSSLLANAIKVLRPISPLKTRHAHIHQRCSQREANQQCGQLPGTRQESFSEALHTHTDL